MKDCRDSKKSFSKKPIAKKPTTRLPMKSSSSGDSEKNARLTLPPETHRLPASTSCRTFIKQPPARLEAFGEALVKRWLERIIVWEDHFIVELKSGLNMDIEG